MTNPLKLIKEAVLTAGALPNAWIEYNFEKLPDDKFITETSFFGIPANFDPKRELNTINVARKFQ